MSNYLRDILRLVVAALLLAIGAAPAMALPVPNLHLHAQGFVYDSPVLISGPLQVQDAATGPLLADVEAGLVLAYRYPGVFPDYELEATLFARGRGRADYGANGAAVELNLRPANGTDRGTYPVGNFSGSLPNNSTLEPNAFVESVWTDTFVVEGGTGVGTATVSVALHGHAETRYGANGTIWYDAEPSFQTFATNQSGSVNYSLRIRYDTLPPGLDREYDHPINFEQSISPPVPAFVSELNVQPDILTGTFVFEYGVPFSLSSGLSVSGYNQITIDYNHTATLSLFDLPDGASLTSGSGHVYPVAGVPEPATMSLLAVGGLLALFRCARRGK